MHHRNHARWSQISPVPFICSMTLTVLMSPSMHVMAAPPLAPPAGSTSDNANMGRAPATRSPTSGAIINNSTGSAQSTNPGTPSGAVRNDGTPGSNTTGGNMNNTGSTFGTTGGVPSSGAYGRGGGGPGTGYDTRANTSMSTGDAAISQKVRNQFNAGGISSDAARNIRVDTTNGTVTLSGQVATQAEADRAMRAARQATGKDVTNKLTIQNK